MASLPLPLAIAAIVLSQSTTPHIKAALAAYEQGNQAQTQKQWQQVVKCFRKAIEIEPTFLEAREALIAAYIDSGRVLDGAAEITELLEIEPKAIKYRIELGQILFERKEPMKALAQFSLVLKQEPQNAEGLLGFAAAARDAGMKERADGARERGRKLYPTDKRFQ